MKGFGAQNKSKKKLNYFRINQQHNKLLAEAVNYHSSGNISEAQKYYRYLINDGFEDARVFNNYGMILILLGKLTEAELSIRKAIELNPQDAASFSNLGGILKDLGKLTEAELSIRKAIELNPDLADAHFNLGAVLKDLGKLKDAELSTRKAIQLSPNLPSAHMSLGIILRDLGELKDAELSTQKAIQLDPTNLGLCYQNLSLLNYAKGNIKLAVENIEKAISIDPNSKDNQLLISVFKNPKQTKIKESSRFPIILNKPINKMLISSLYKIKSLDLNKLTDPSFGNARGSDYKLFDDNEKITEDLQKDLTKITKDAIGSDVFFRDSFFTILGGKSTINKHNHLGRIDKFKDLNLWEQKYSLVYYLSIGDQNCKNPGILKFYDNEHDMNSNQEILPSEGMIVIFPADRYHSVKYDGKKDRIIIGVNFYSI